MTAKIKNPPIICTDDGWLLSATPPLTLEEMKEKMIDAYAGTPAALWWSTGDHEIYQFETEIGELVGAALGDGDSVADRAIAANVRHLIETCGGPLSALIGLCRAADLPFFPRVRMNSHYDVDPSSPGWGRFRREHPELLIGRPGEDLPEGSIEHGIRTGLNYVFPQVRQYMAAIICEVFERFDVDGVEMDFMRHPAFFRTTEAFQNRHHMTDLLCHVRAHMDQAGAERGKHIQLAVRVPPTLADAARIGLDVTEWMAAGLVDIVVAGGGFIPYETPIEEFVRAGESKGVQVYGCIEATRHADEKNLRAIASRFWAAGAAGIYLYNFYTAGPEWNKRVLNQLADPEALKYLDKRYELDQSARFTTPYHCAYPVTNIEAAFRYGNPAAQLPIVLEQSLAGQGPRCCLEVADDLAAARTAGALARCTLTLRFDGLTPDDELALKLNQVSLQSSSRQGPFYSWKRQEVEAQFWTHYPVQIVEVEQPCVYLEFEVDCPPLRQGKNELEIHLLTRDRAGCEPVVLKAVELLVEYEER
jgi:hypothetical protein